MNFNKEIKNIGIIFFCILLLIIVWIFQYTQHNLQFTFSSLIKIHQDNSIIVLLEISIIICAIVYYFIHRNDKKIIDEQETTIKDQQNIINLNADYAKKIGDGDYDFYIPADNKNDIVASSLALMRRKMLTKK